MYRTTLVALSLAAVFSTACGPPDGGGGPITGVNPDGTPKWVNRGSGAYDGEHGKAFYGVGIVTGIDNPALLRQTGDNRARGEIAKLFDTYIAAMMKDYQRSTTTGNFKASAEEQIAPRKHAARHAGSELRARERPTGLRGPGPRPPAATHRSPQAPDLQRRRQAHLPHRSLCADLHLRPEQRLAADPERDAELSHRRLALLDEHPA